MEWVQWWAILASASALVALLIAVGERGEKRELVKSRDEARAICDLERAKNRLLERENVRLERLLTRELLRSDNNRTVDDAEIVPVSFEERAG